MKLKDRLPDIFEKRAELTRPSAQRAFDGSAHYSAAFDARDTHGRATSRVLDVRHDPELKTWAWRTRRHTAPGGVWYYSDESIARALAEHIAQRNLAECQARLWAAQSLAKIPA